MAPRGGGSRVSSAQEARGTRGSQIRCRSASTDQARPTGRGSPAAWRPRLLATGRRCRPGMPHGCSHYACAYLLFANRREPCKLMCVSGFRSGFLYLVVSLSHPWCPQLTTKDGKETMDGYFNKLCLTNRTP